jgi:transcriptional regulator GlxA family with amidase domain
MEAEYLHHHILQLLQKRRVDSLQIDELVMQLLNKILLTLGNVTELPVLPEKLKQNHLVTIERAKEYMLNNFSENISLNELAEHCFVSPFHFSRIFKTVLNVSPHQFLLSTRLNHAKILLTTTDKPVNDIGFESGFNSLEHFVTAYKQQFKLSPSQHRNQLV